MALHDATPTEQISTSARAFCEQLPAQRFYTTPSGKLQLCHGLGTNDMASLMPDDDGYALQQNLDLFRLTRDGAQRYVVHGHTHRRMVRTIEGVTFLNPGTLYRGQDPGFVLVDLALGEARFFDVASSVREASVMAVPV
jgi:predicted phosphodiesterase